MTIVVYVLAGYGLYTAADNVLGTWLARRRCRRLESRLDQFGANENPFHEFADPRDPLPRFGDRRDWP